MELFLSAKLLPVSILPESQQSAIPFINNPGDEAISSDKPFVKGSIGLFENSG
jgi:hypothetical protein